MLAFWIFKRYVSVSILGKSCARLLYDQGWEKISATPAWSANFVRFALFSKLNV